MIPDQYGNCCSKGQGRGKVKFNPGNTSNIMNNHVRKHHPSVYNSYKSTSAKSLNAAQHGEQALSLLASKTL